MPVSRPDLDPTPLIINGTGGAVGSFALKLASINPSISPIIAIASPSSQAAAKALGADFTADYRSPSIATDLANILKNVKNADKLQVYDTTNTDNSVTYLSSVLDPKYGKYTCTSKITPTQKPILEKWGGWHEQIWVGSVHEDQPAGGVLFGTAMCAVFERLIVEGKLAGQAWEVSPGGLQGVKDALTRLRDRKGGNTKFVTRIADTPGLKEK
jgi:NADPH:quinone reductase